MDHSNTLNQKINISFYPKAVIFDMDGLLVDSERPNMKAWQGAAKEQGQILTDDMYRSFIGRGTDECERTLVQTFGSDFDLDKHRTTRKALLQEITKKGIAYMKGAVSLVSWLYQKEIPIGLATSSYRKEVPQRVKELIPYFVTYSGREDAKLGKPAPDLYVVTAEKMEVNPKDVLVLEDSNAGVEAAHRAEMQVVMVPDMLQPTEDSLAWSLFRAKDLIEVKHWLSER